MIAAALSLKEKHLCSMPWRAAMDSQCITQKTCSCCSRQVLTVKHSMSHSHTVLQTASQWNRCIQMRAFVFSPVHLYAFSHQSKPSLVIRLKYSHVVLNPPENGAEPIQQSKCNETTWSMYGRTRTRPFMLTFVYGWLRYQCVVVQKSHTDSDTGEYGHPPITYIW